MILFSSSKTEEAERTRQDNEVLKKELRQIMAGEQNLVSLENIVDTEIASLVNQIILKTKGRNNEYVERMNESLKVATKSSIVKEMLETVSEQTGSIDNMRESSKELEDSISSITNVVDEVKKYVSEAVVTTVKSVDNMNHSIDVVSQSSQDINQINTMIQQFKTKTAKINEIVDIVKQVAEQSNLLALNASIEAARAGEAGRGFSVVASEVKVLSDSTTASAEDIMKYIKELQTSIDELVVNISNTSKRLENGNDIVEKSVSDIKTINGQMATINKQMEHIFEDVAKQDKTVETFVGSINGITNTYNDLAALCEEAGQYIFNIIRHSDKIRGSIARYSANLSQKEWMDIFETDHIIFTWRLHNAVGKFEKLELQNVSNVDGCKLGKWVHSVTDPKILSNQAFIKLKDDHRELHEYAVKCFNEIEQDNLVLADKYYNDAERVLESLTQDIKKVKSILS